MGGGERGGAGGGWTGKGEEEEEEEVSQSEAKLWRVRFVASMCGDEDRNEDSNSG